jgi:hypothetical protein
MRDNISAILSKLFVWLQNSACSPWHITSAAIEEIDFDTALSAKRGVAHFTSWLTGRLLRVSVLFWHNYLPELYNFR